jgi:uracil-DNA glycosylase
MDASGERLRDWLGIDAAEFYDPTKIALLPKVRERMRRLLG